MFPLGQAMWLFFLTMFDEHIFDCNQALGLPHACLLDNLVVLMFLGYTLKIITFHHCSLKLIKLKKTVAMLNFNTKAAFEVFGMDYVPTQPDPDNVLMESWEVWTKFGHRSLWRVKHYQSGWMDWCLTNVGHGFHFF